MLRFVGDGLALPGRVVLDANLTILLPRYAWTANRLGTMTSGSGLGDDGMRRALGEYFERRHFYHEVRGDAKGSIASLENASLRESLVRALRQTAAAAVRDRLPDREFALSTVVKLPDFEPVRAPTIMFSVGDDTLEQDGDYLPCRDTSGCAAHFELPRAIGGALREFAERQFLLRYWLTARGARDISARVDGKMSQAAADLARKLRQCGELHFLEISGRELNGAVVLVVYRGSRDRYVRYCVGLSCDAQSAAAADRALKELWQSYMFLRNMAPERDAKKMVHDRYHVYFLACNSTQTADAMLSGIDDSGEADSCWLPDDLLASIQRRFTHLLCYVRQVDVLTRRLWCVRVMSADAFLHMDNSRHFNFYCSFSDSFRTQVRPERLARMVPFP